MSVRTMARVWEHSRHGGSELLMLLAIADFADDDGRAYPSVATLARKTRMGSRNANYLLKALQASGELTVRLNEGPKGSNLYRINLDLMAATSATPCTPPAKLCTPSTPATPCTPPLQRSSSPPATQFPRPLQPVADEPSLNHQGTTKEPKNAAPSAPVDRVKQMFDVGVQLLEAAGSSPSAARSLIGKLRKHRGDEDALKVINAAARSTDAASFIAAAAQRQRTHRGFADRDYSGGQL